MKKILIGITGFIILVVVAGVIAFFGFDKKIPTNWVSSQITAVKEFKFTTDEKLPNAKYFREKIKYEQDGNKKIVIYEEKYYMELENTSTDSAESYKIKTKIYDEKGELTEEYITKYFEQDGNCYKEEKGNKEIISDFSEVLSFFAPFSGFFDNDGYFTTEIKDLIDNNLQNVTQKGTNITLHIEKENAKLNIVYSLTSKKVNKIDVNVDFYNNNVLSSRAHQYLAF